MSAFFDAVDRDLIKTLAALGQSFVFKTKTIACGITRPAAGNDPVEGGSWDAYAGTVLTRRALLVTAGNGIPEQGDTITVDGKAVFVGKVKSDADCPLVTIPFQNEPYPK